MDANEKKIQEVKISELKELHRMLNEVLPDLCAFYFKGLSMAVLGLITIDGEVSDIEYEYYREIQKIVKEKPMTKTELNIFIKNLAIEAKTGADIIDMQRKILMMALDIFKSSIPQMLEQMVEITVSFLTAIAQSDKKITKSEAMYIEPISALLD